VWSYATPSVQWTEWAEVVIGVLVFLAPWALAFSALTSIATSTWIAGILAVLLAGSVLLGERDLARMAEQH
jgi:VIT1/CCC1 family predicted Fe2+/Mn2+ transporter